jgi:hypothetical protein
VVGNGLVKKAGYELSKFAPVPVNPEAIVEYADEQPLGGQDDVLLGVHVQLPDGGLAKPELVAMELAS